MWGGCFCEELNGSDYMAIPLKETEKMRIGYVKRKGASISHIGQIYIEELKKYKEKIVLINGLYQPFTLPMATPPTMCFERIR